MKTLALLFTLFLSLSAWSLSYDPLLLVVDLDSPGQTKVLSSSETLFYDMIIQAKPGNTGTLLLGDATADPTTGIVLDPGTSISFSNLTQKAGARIDLRNWFISGANAADGVTLLLIKVR